MSCQTAMSVCEVRFQCITKWKISLIVLLFTSTHIQVTDSAGKSMVRTSCGTEGFRNIKKSTPIAAQTAGISAAAVIFSITLLACF